MFSRLWFLVRFFIFLNRRTLFKLFRQILMLRINLIRRMSQSNQFAVRKDLPFEHLFDFSELNVYDSKVINLSAGTPGKALLMSCCENFQTATKHRMEFEKENGAYLFQYGPTVGAESFRKNLAKFLSKGYQGEVHHSDLIVTSGASHGLGMILSTLIEFDGVIIIDEVTYMIALTTIAQFSSLKVVTVPLTKDGVNTDVLEQKLAEYSVKPKTKLFSCIYYTIPTYHNPSGILFTEAVNKTLIKVARKYDALIVCDDVYNLLHYTESSPKRLFAYDNFEDDDFKGNVISNGTFSKLLSPGIRLGWMEGPPRVVEAFQNCGILRSGGAANHYQSGIINSFIELNLLEKQLKWYAQVYKDGLQAMVGALERLHKCCEFLKPDGGYFIFIKFPENVDCNKMNDFCQENHKVIAIGGTRFSVEGKHKNWLRLSFAFHPVSVLVEGVNRLCNGIDEYLNNNHPELK